MKNVAQMKVGEIDVDEWTAEALQEYVDLIVQGTRLSERETQVHMLILTGNERKQIAEKLNISVEAVDVYRSRIKSKAKESERTLDFIKTGRIPDND